MGLSLCVGCWRRYTVPLLECHPELVSGSHYSIYPLVFVCEIYEMLKRVQHDSIVWIPCDKKLPRCMAVLCGFGVTKEERIPPISSLRGLEKPKQSSIKFESLYKCFYKEGLSDWTTLLSSQ